MNRAEIREKTKVAATSLIFEKGYAKSVDLYVKVILLMEKK